MSAGEQRWALFASCAPGLEPWLEAELRALGLRRLRRLAGGLGFWASMAQLQQSHLQLGLAMDIRARVGRFEARRLDKLAEQTAALPWERYLQPQLGLKLKVSCKKSRLYHSGAVEQRVREGIQRRLPQLAEGAAAQTVHVRLHRDDCQLSLDLSGEPLYRRGYRRATGKAPLRADLARALLVIGGYDGQAPLWDPLCGAGTIPIEAALLAGGRAPGLNRDFAFMQLPDFDPRPLAALRERLQAEAKPPPAPIFGSDRDAGVIASAIDNAARAGVQLTLEQAALKAASPPSRPDAGGLIATHPPYGHRTQDAGLQRLHRALGQVTQAPRPGWRLALITARPDLARATGLPLQSRLQTQHNGHRLGLFYHPAPPDPRPGES